MTRLYLSQLDVFLRLIGRTTKDGDCWIWTAGRVPKGYGSISLGGNTGTVRSHRVMCRVAHGPAPFANAHACHTCDRPACVNPAHLFWGTPLDNVADAVNKGRRHRQPGGDASFRTRLSDADLAAMRREHAAGASARSISMKYGVSASYGYRVIHGQRRAAHV